MAVGVVGCALLAVLAGCTSPAKTGASARATVRTSPVSATRKASPAGHTATATPSESKRPASPPEPSALPVGPADAGALPQTSALPATTSAAFRNAEHDIWLAVETGDPAYARPAFFPEKAYEQVKAIADPQGDWQGRLWYDFTLDLADAHKLVKSGATFTRVTTVAQYAQWIPPGACYNSIGYWHLPGSRLVYRQDGATYSFGLASFISWRGNWYLIHLGALVRSGAYGIVDDPSAGPGVPGPPGGC